MYFPITDYNENISNIYMNVVNTFQTRSFNYTHYFSFLLYFTELLQAQLGFKISVAFSSTE